MPMPSDLPMDPTTNERQWLAYVINRHDLSSPIRHTQPQGVIYRRGETADKKRYGRYRTAFYPLDSTGIFRALARALARDFVYKNSGKYILYGHKPYLLVYQGFTIACINRVLIWVRISSNDFGSEE